MKPRSIAAGLVGLTLAAGLGLAACGSPGEESADDSRAASPDPGQLAPVADLPAGPDALAPNLAVLSDGLAASWLEPHGEGHRFRVAVLRDGAWSEPVTISAGEKFFANWADLPGIVETGRGELLAHWLEKTAPDTYAYSIMLARSGDGGATWRPAGQLNSDSTPTEHGFVSWVVEGDGARAFWLDGRAMAEGGDMTVRTAHVDRRLEGEEVLDERTCECCSTDATRAGEKALVVYRDRDGEEVRDIAIVGGESGSWSEPALVAADGWRIEGCPVNGPAAAAEGERVAVAWFSGAASEPVVQVAFSGDGGASFAAPVALDRDAPVGRVDLALDGQGDAWVSWIATAGEGGLLRLAEIDPAGQRRADLVVSEIGTARASGVPRLALVGDVWYLAWVEAGEDARSRIRLASGPTGPAGL